RSDFANLPVGPRDVRAAEVQILADVTRWHGRLEPGHYRVRGHGAKGCSLPAGNDELEVGNCDVPAPETEITAGRTGLVSPYLYAVSFGPPAAADIYRFSRNFVDCRRFPAPWIASRGTTGWPAGPLETQF